MNVLLLQLPVPNNPATNVPLAAGYLLAYAEAQGLSDEVAIAIVPRELADYGGDALLVREIVARRPDVLGLSLYTWNSERSLAIAERVRRQLPDLAVIAGGPEVQRDNEWLLRHPALDIGVVGEGEQTFCDLLRLLQQNRNPSPEALLAIPGLVFRHGEQIAWSGERTALQELAATIPSPYLAGHLEVVPGGMLMVEVSRWCPYSCSFCLYGRNMGPRLGNRYFDLQRVLAEIRWGKERGVRSVHFVEANLNLVPLFWPLMHALADLNADKQLTFYAELRGEHLSDAVVAALDAANVRVVEVGLQTANPEALKASQRRTDLHKWAAGTRRLYAHGIEVFLDVILGLPADDERGVAQTLAFIADEGLGPYDVFTLQLLPGTAVRRDAVSHGMHYQDRPPYYVLATERMAYGELRALRRSLKAALGHDPDGVEGLPEPRRDALATTATWGKAPDMLGSHVDLRCLAAELDSLTPWLTQALQANPSSLFDLYLLADEPPDAAALRHWRESLPYLPGYLDRVAVYRREQPLPAHLRVSPRLFVVLPWTAQVLPEAYVGVAEVVWRYELAAGEEPPLRAWRAAGGAGVWVCGSQAAEAQARSWEQQAGIVVWYAEREAPAHDESCAGGYAAGGLLGTS